MKIIHCADFHLDAPLAQLPPDKAALRRNELLQTFGRVVSYAAQHAVDAVLIAGDWFDAPIAARKTVDYVRIRRKLCIFSAIRGAAMPSAT